MWIRNTIIIIALAFAPTGCAAIAKALPHVIAAVSEAAQILDMIDASANAYWASHPDPEKKAEYEQLMETTRLALAAATRAAQGADKLNQEQIDAGFADFRKAYQALIAFTDRLGFASQAAGEGDMLQAKPGGGVVVPPPMALTLQVE